MNIDSIIKLFRVYLNDSWKVVSEFSKYFPDENREEFFNNFFQSGWEMLVEMPLNIFLEVYGEGSDLNDDIVLSSRIWHPEIQENYKVICKINKSVKDYYNSEFVDFKEGVFKKFINEDLIESPPFNIAIVLDECDTELAFNVDDITFDIEKND